MNLERRTKSLEPGKRKDAVRRELKESGAVADPGVPACNLGTRETGNLDGTDGIRKTEADAPTPETGSASLVASVDSVPVPSASSAENRPELSDDVEIPGESSRQRRDRLAREATARLHAEMALIAETEPEPERHNPLFDLAEEPTERLFKWLRECPYHDAVKAMLEAELGIPDVTDHELEEFFEMESQTHWHRRLSRAATEANALVSYIENNPVKFSAGILAALGQEAFRQVASGQVAPEAMTRMTNLFLKARADERSDQLMDLRREKMELDRRTHTEAALEAFAAEIEKHPAAREAFEALRAELLRGKEELE